MRFTRPRPRTRARSAQLELPLPKPRRPRKRGPKRKPTSGVPHLRRASLTRHTPVHLTLRIRGEIKKLRTTARFRVIRRALTRAKNRFGFRLVHFSVQDGHLHLIAEANDRRALSRGVQGLAIRVARGMNRLLGRRGKVFADRYHAHVLRHPREVRNALVYVINNVKHHALQGGATAPKGAFDPCSSAEYFDGWKTPRIRCGGSTADGDEPPVVPAACWLLRTGWRRHGLVHVDEVPGLRRRDGRP